MKTFVVVSMGIGRTFIRFYKTKDSADFLLDFSINNTSKSEKKIDDTLPSSEKAIMAIKYYYEIQYLYPDTTSNRKISNVNNCIQRFGMVLWGKSIFDELRLK
ncbi:hypothetical protein [Helicobacter cappadocius]|uniref:Uncharacterized protein n=1 Tax=Helicobacter cappadocius TaxID=3063998 RepID=A0AA90PHU9_9HELI|nr:MULTISPECIES: hypothetical protein [unclassified Helicobacter]MDO7252694.1 hypothetical protein [Helicobacter sp. faydin-H75]MDP2538562.1 hypothetical protein [Helicobacter sp. faydin-H76]